MSHDSTMKLVTNLDRAAIEGMPRAQIEASVKNALKWAAAKGGLSDITGPLELVELNLPNLK
ncbi:MAG: hypothetical protein EXR31_03880 [Betaproteobacteria bacterium]|nr:hypothetical protein [Betaproteobacteria bacterium]